MRVALDGTPLTLSSGGLRRYTEELIRALRAEFPDDEYLLVSDQLTPPENSLDRKWWSIGLPRKLSRSGCDLFHGTDFAVPYLPLRPSVMTVHDLSPWMNPEWHHAAQRVRERTPILIGLGLATMLIVPTDAIKRQVVDRFNISPSRIAVVPEAAAAHLRPAAAQPGRYFLFVGTIEPRKNVPALISAWKHVRETWDVDLVLIGRIREDAPPIEPVDGLHLRGETPEDELASFYSGAVALVYPSLYEGFGLPILEAMQCGCPVICSKDAALMEVAGNAAVHVNPDGLAGAMTALLEHPDESEHRRQASLRRASEFSWSRTARLTREVYVEAVRRA